MTEEKKKIYLAIDLKSFYASVECVDRRLDPLAARLVVADESRTEKTICLAVSPALKAYGIPGRARLFEVIEKAKIAGVDFIVAPPRMARYMEVSSRIVDTYCRFVSPDDLFVYSIDEVFIDISRYPGVTWETAENFAMKLVNAVLETTGITATCGIGENLFLCKVAMDIDAKHMDADENGVRISKLSRTDYRKKLWNHEPITDFWGIGKGISTRLERYGIMTMGDLCRFSLDHENELYDEFGVNAEIIIDHAWGNETAEISTIKSYVPKSRSFTSGQVLAEPYGLARCRIIVKEMAEEMVYRLVSHGMVTDRINLQLSTNKRERRFNGTENFGKFTDSKSQIVSGVMKLYDRIMDPEAEIRYINLSAVKIIPKEEVSGNVQLSLFEDPDDDKNKDESALVDTILKMREKYGANAILTGNNFREGATMKERHRQIGGHKA